MDITLDKSAANETSIKLKIVEADYQPGVENRAKEYSKKANIKGFRPGKVPVGMIKKMYGASLLVDEINELVSKSLNSYIQDNKLNIIGEPLPVVNEEIDFKTQKEFEFEYEIGLVEEFSVNLAQKADQYEIQVADEDIEKTIDELKIQMGERSTPDEVSEEDNVYGEISLPGEEEPVKVLVDVSDLATKTGKSIFVDMKKEESKTFDIRKAYRSNEKLANFLNRTEEEVKEIEGDVEFKVLNISRTVPAEINQEFFDKALGKDQVTNEEEFRAKLKELLGENYNRETEAYAEKNLRDELVKNTEITLPQTFFKKWLLASQKDLTEEKVDADFDKYIEELKWMLISDKIVMDNNIEINNSDIQEMAAEQIKQQFLQYGLPPEQLEENLAGFVDNYLKAENGQNYMNIMQQLKFSKVIEKVKEASEINKKETTVDEFKEIINN
ncbi:trigger factor [Aureibacter tunicatorum]|uniref:Trigger factor n=1 Tax=Aureibacter tunicatorum TaxID=866807 RepID=A0AAE3XRZ3_9BACT|nr:trigger factor [Aureibacter tunicatorum]MDR6240885.1 trigger factor [Aureibacter tunicatorum]BDD03665.1 trigger factor [Aureibacter tunicatorum]